MRLLAFAFTIVFVWTGPKKYTSQSFLFSEPSRISFSISRNFNQNFSSNGKRPIFQLGAGSELGEKVSQSSERKSFKCLQIFSDVNVSKNSRYLSSKRSRYLCPDRYDDGLE